MNTTEVALILNFTSRRVTQLLNKKELIGRKIGRRWYVAADEVQRYRNKGNPKLRPDPAHALLVVNSGHKDALCDSAREINRQMVAPICQLAGFPALESENPALSIIPQRGRPSVYLEVEETEMFTALKGHMPDSDIWHVLHKWKNEVANLITSLHKLGEYVGNREEVKTLGFTALDEIRHRGLLAPFPSTVAVNAVEDSYVGRWVNQTFEVNVDVNGPVLTWSRGGTRYAIACGSRKEELDVVEELHNTLRRRLGEREEVSRAAESFKGLDNLESQLKQEVVHISNLATIAGVCELCRL